MTLLRFEKKRALKEKRAKLAGPFFVVIITIYHFIILLRDSVSSSLFMGTKRIPRTTITKQAISPSFCLIFSLFFVIQQQQRQQQMDPWTVFVWFCLMLVIIYICNAHIAHIHASIRII
jgi:hypothetical protein